MSSFKNIIFLSTLMICNFFFSKVEAQQIAGTWYNQNFGITLTMDLEMNYSIYSAQNILTESGKFAVEGSYLYLQNSMNGLTNTYEIRLLDQTTLHCYDVYSAQEFKFIKQENGNNSSNASLPEIKGDVLFEQDGVQLLQGHVDAYIDLMEFTVGQSLSTEDKLNIRKSCEKGFSTNPQGQVADAVNVHQSMHQLYALKDITQINAGRMLFISEFYKNWNIIKDEEVGRILLKYAPIEVFDANSGLALTRKDLDGFINFIDFMNADIAGGSAMTMDQKQSYKDQIMSQFSLLSVEQQASICMGNMLNTMIRENWNTMNASQRAQVKQQLTQQTAYQYTPQNSGTSTYDDSWLEGFQDGNWKPSSRLQELRAKVNSGTATEADFMNYKAEMDTQNMFFNTMNNMNLQSHVTSLNIIENMGGGSGNYWEVVDY